MSDDKVKFCVSGVREREKEREKEKGEREREVTRTEQSCRGRCAVRFGVPI